ncbi:hypothetical protein CYMTET_12824 [Cymbomonas tetramitiformis]|uniref:Uncharacterized protein n=1 Tax=Cymbomonas tetramitiformis TaxID=36881 RepID=A0AAE0GJQ3_9CHLO|nr:hypothetical protein CYMTET_12824 [Cymbomonas tetramitiformis]
MQWGLQGYFAFEDAKHLMQYLAEQRDAKANNVAQPQGEERMQQHNERYATPNDANSEALEELNELAELQETPQGEVEREPGEPSTKESPRSPESAHS